MKPLFIMTRRIAINMIIIFVVALFLIIGFGFAFPESKTSENLEETTGVVAKFKQYDPTWADYVFSSSPSSYFNVWLEDGSFFKATGTYSMIDRALFEELQVGDEITITHDDGGFWGPDAIYGIEYHGKTYLSVDKVLSVHENDKQPMFIWGISLVVLTVIVGGVGLFLNNYKFRKKQQ